MNSQLCCGTTSTITGCAANGGLGHEEAAPTKPLPRCAEAMPISNAAVPRVVGSNVSLTAIAPPGSSLTPASQTPRQPPPSLCPGPNAFRRITLDTSNSSRVSITARIIKGRTLRYFVLPADHARSSSPTSPETTVRPTLHSFYPCPPCTRLHFPGLSKSSRAPLCSRR